MEQISQFKPTGIVTDPRFADHCMGPEEPECPQRALVLSTVLQEPDFVGRLTSVPARPAKETELLAVHSPEYIQRLASTSGKQITFLSEDTRTCALSNRAALLAAGGICRAIEQVHLGNVANAFALIRPPGHHAEREAAGGFCLVNNVAVGARYAQQVLGMKRLLIVDWDLHHGNGTQACFVDDPSVLFFSTHRAFAYPGSGALREIGKGDGRGLTINIPLLPGCGDGEYVALFENFLRPVALEFRPDLVLVSAGFDLHFNDPLGGMRVTPQGFAGMTRTLMDLAERCCQGKLVLVLEGGYDLEGLSDSVRAVLKEMTGLQTTANRHLVKTADLRRIRTIVWRLQKKHGRYWQCLKDPSSPKDFWQKPGCGERLLHRISRWIAYFKD